jgi:hypothetical protein
MVITREGIISAMLQDVEAARQTYKEYWFSWSTIGGKSYEGVLWEIDNNTHHVLCTDGVERAV